MAEKAPTNVTGSRTLHRLARMFDAAAGLRAASRRLQNDPGVPTRKASRATSVDVDRFMELDGAGQTWARPEYGRYYATSVAVYSAIKVRSEALARPPLVAYAAGATPDVARIRQAGLSADTRLSPPFTAGVFGGMNLPLERGDTGGSATSWLPVGFAHPVQRLLDRVNPWYTGASSGGPRGRT